MFRQKQKIYEIKNGGFMDFRDHSLSICYYRIVRYYKLHHRIKIRLGGNNMTWEKLLDFVALNLKKFVIVLVSTGLLLFLPEQILVRFNLLDLINEKRSIISILFLISISGTFVELIDKLLKSIKEKMEIKSNRKAQMYLLKTLGEDEKEFLEDFVKNNLSTTYASYNSGTAKSLCSKRIIHYGAQTTSDHNMTISYNIQPWALELLIKHKSLLKR